MTRRKGTRTGRSRSAPAESPAHDRQPSRRTALACLAAFCVLFTVSQVFTYSRTSATWDEPGHLLAGYAALTRGDYRVDVEHPPLLRMWAALPLLGMEVNTGALDAVERASADALAFQGPFTLGHRFLYADNDADRLLYRARFMIVLLGVLLGVLVFAWACEWLGPRGGIVALLLYATEPNIAAHATLATTDFGVTCFLFAAVYFLWRTARSASRFNIVCLTVSFVLALLSKFSALVLGPVIVVLLAWLVMRRRLRPAAAAGLLAVLIGAALLGVWAAYGFRVAQSQTPGWSLALHAHPAAIASVPGTAALVGWLEAHHVLPSALLQGVLHGQGLATGRPAFLMGDYSLTGWWYYFPLAVLLKTPITLLALAACGLAWRKRPEAIDSDTIVFLVVTVVIFMAVAMRSALNIGVRHVLPVYPFLVLAAAAGAGRLVATARRRAAAILAVVATAALLEFGLAYPHTLAFFNLIAGGPHNGFRSLADSNVDWGQDLKPLKQWMDDNRVGTIGLAYFGTASPAYYGMNVRYMWGTTVPGVKPEDMGPPSLPGYVAVSVTLLDGVPFQEHARDFYKPLRDREPVADIGGSIRVYRVDKPWW